MSLATIIIYKKHENRGVNGGTEVLESFYPFLTFLIPVFSFFLIEKSKTTSFL